MLLSMVIAYLFVTIAIGLWAARRVKNTADFAIAGRHLPMYMIITTTFATWFGSEIVLGVPAKFIEGGLRGVVEEADRVVRLVRVEPESPHEGVEDVRCRAQAALLDARVVVGADRRELRHFLPPQPGDAARAGVREADVGGREAPAAGAQEVAEFLQVRCGARGSSHVARLVPDLHRLPGKDSS